MGVRIFGYYPSGNGITPAASVSDKTLDVGVINISANTGVQSPGALMCALYIISGNDTNGLSWVPLRLDWLK